MYNDLYGKKAVVYFEDIEGMGLLQLKLMFERVNKMKFEIKCKECNSTDCVIEEVIDYDWEENPISDGYTIYCRECGSEERI